MAWCACSTDAPISVCLSTAKSLPRLDGLTLLDLDGLDDAADFEGQARFVLGRQQPHRVQCVIEPPAHPEPRTETARDGAPASCVCAREQAAMIATAVASDARAMIQLRRFMAELPAEREAAGAERVFQFGEAAQARRSA